MTDDEREDMIQTLVDKYCHTVKQKDLRPIWNQLVLLIEGRSKARKEQEAA